MRITLAIALTLLLTGSIAAAEVDLDTSVDLVTIYHNGALVERSAPISLSAGTHVISIEQISSKMVLNSFKVDNREITVLQKELIKKLTSEQFEQLLDQKYTLEAQLTLLEAKYSEVGFVDEVSELERMMQYYSQKIQEIKRYTRENDRKIAEAQAMEDIVMLNPDAAILKLTISISKPLKEDLKFQYIVGAIGWSPSYEIEVDDSSDDSMAMKYLAKVMNQTGEDWKNVIVHLSSASPVGDPIVLPQQVNPWVLSNNRAVQQNQGLYENAGVQGVYNFQWGTVEDLDKLQGVQYQQINVPSFLKARVLEGRYNIPSNGTVFTYPIMSVEIAADYYYYGYPSLDPEVYLVAELTGWDTLGFVDGMANISFGGNEVGRSLIAFSEVQDTLVLPIGRDNSVYMARSEMADQKYFKETWSGKKRKSTLAYEFTLKNNNSFPVEFKLIDQMPISQTKSAEVEIETISKANLDKTNGELVWDLVLTPGAVTKKQLIYTIDMDAGFSYSKSGKGKQQYRSINAPSF